ncbi:MAG: nonspecific lipid-transfer protein [bacterium]
MREACIVGIGRTAFTRDSGRSVLAQAAEAARSAIADSGLTPADIDGMSSFQANDSILGYELAEAIGIEEVRWNRDLLGGGNLAAAIVSSAALAVSAGLCESAVVFRAMNGRSGFRFGTAQDRTIQAKGEMQFQAPQGYVAPPQWMAMWARRHQEIYGSTCEDLGQIAIVQNRHAAANPHALGRKPLTMESYLASRWIHEPLRLYDCAFEADGAVALVVTTAERARDLPQDSVRILGYAESSSKGGSWDQWPDTTTMCSASVAPRLWAATGLGPKDIDVACIYDCFTYSAMVGMEDYGFCERGEVGRFCAEGRSTYGGDVVVNPHGGLLAEGYLHGFNHHYEAVLQLRHAAAARQVADARVALVTAGAGPVGGGIIYAREGA